MWMSGSEAEMMTAKAAAMATMEVMEGRSG
jgi:hypothetical protein